MQFKDIVDYESTFQYYLYMVKVLSDISTSGKITTSTINEVVNSCLTESEKAALLFKSAVSIGSTELQVAKATLENLAVFRDWYTYIVAVVLKSTAYQTLVNYPHTSVLPYEGMDMQAHYDKGIVGVALPPEVEAAAFELFKLIEPYTSNPLWNKIPLRLKKYIIGPYTDNGDNFIAINGMLYYIP